MSQTAVVSGSQDADEELIAFDDDIRMAILDSSPSSKIADMIKAKKIKTLTGSALDKVRKGITTLEEVIRVTGQDVE